MKKCVCGLEILKNNTRHYTSCDERKKLRKEILIENREKIIEEYLRTFSVSEILRNINSKFKLHGFSVVTRKDLVNILKKENVYEGLNGKNYLKNKVEKNKKIMMEKYGVENWGQTSNGGYKSLNKIPYKKISYLSDGYKKYREQVEEITRKNIKEIELPKYCEYTGIKFSDEEGKTNPNDPRKRSVDHKISVMICYLNDISVEEAGSKDNIVFVLKYVNTIKGNTLHESFLTIADKIRKVFINEGYESIQITRKV